MKGESCFSFTKSTAIAERIWQELSIDFITDLPESQGNRNIVVVTDRLGKGVDSIPIRDLTAETLAWAIIEHVFSRHGLLRAIVSDRGTQIAGNTWRCVCRLLNIEQRLSTAYHPETDGATERTNQVLEKYISHHYISFAQDDWCRLIRLTRLAINNQDAASTGDGEYIVVKLRQAVEFAQSAMAAAQERQEAMITRRRDPDLHTR